MIDYETLTIENTIYLNNITSDLHLSSYTCAIRQQKSLDEYSTESDKFQLNVTFKPIIEIVVSNSENSEMKIKKDNIVYLFKSVDNSMNVAFKCKYNSNPKPNSILWFRNGVIIDNKCKQSIHLKENKF